MTMRRLFTTTGITIALAFGIPPASAQAPTTFFQVLSRPNNQANCETMDCWLEATRACTPTTFSTDISMGIAATNSVFELWGTTATGGCVYYQFVQSLEAFGQNVPDGSGMEIICLYNQGTDLTLEWEVFLGKRDGTFGGTGGLVDPKTGISVNSKTVNDREVAQCAIKMPSAIRS